MRIISCSSPYFQKKQSQPVKFSGIHLRKPSEKFVRVPNDETGRDVWYTRKDKDTIINAQPYLQRSKNDPLYQFHIEKISKLLERTKRVIQASGKVDEGRSSDGRQEPPMGSIPEEEENTEVPKKD